MKATGDLAAFLWARLDEDEAVARLAAREGGTWKQDDPVRYPGSISSLGGRVVYDEGAPDENQAPHIARHDPARVLREVEAKRAILAEHALETDATCSVCVTTRDRWKEDWPLDAWPCQTVRHLAAVYSGHPEFNDAWRV